jgi:hypothetical protein
VSIATERVVAVVAAVVVAAVAALLLAPGGRFRAHADPQSEPLPQPSEGRCPKQQMQPLPGDAVARAALAAVDQAPAVYRGTKLGGMRVTEAILATLDDAGRGGYARTACGRKAQNRTVVVSLEFPAMRPSASLSQGVVLVARFSGQYRVWAQLH